LVLESSIRFEEVKFQSGKEDKYYQQLIGQAKSSGLKIISFEELGTIREDNYLKSTISIKMAGSYRSLINYIKQIETDVYPVTVRSLIVSAPNSISTTLDCELTLAIYRNANG
jgi:Tfp pilus assembly protein PilO